MIAILNNLTKRPVIRAHGKELLMNTLQDFRDETKEVERGAKRHVAISLENAKTTRTRLRDRAKPHLVYRTAALVKSRIEQQA